MAYCQEYVFRSIGPFHRWALSVYRERSISVSNLSTTLLVVLAAIAPCSLLSQDSTKATVQGPAIQLPAPRFDSPCSVEKALLSRRSVRAFKEESISMAVLSQLLWAAQGITLKMDAPPNWAWGPWQGGKRTAPSAGALYPLELYVVAGNVEGLKPGVYKYKPQSHQLFEVETGDKRSELAAAAVGQKWIQSSPCVFVVGAVYSRTEVKYGERAARYAHIEVGHAVENVCLQALALDLGTTMVGAFKDDEVKKVVGMSAEEQPLAIVPVGKGTS
jgi:SagB-type dehydrogenase family enzyme